MAAYNKFQDFVEQLCLAKHSFAAAGDVFRCMLVNSPAPVNTNTVKADLTEIAAGNGYTAGGEDAQNTVAESPAGTSTVSGTKIVWTASGGTIGPFRYVIFYNDTQTSPLDPLVAWWDYLSNLTLNSGETFTVKFNNGDPTGTIFTVT
jgi:hypothetical protein